MTQTSGPISQGTTAERQFTDVLWRDLFGDEPGVLGDLDGSAYAITLPTGSDIATVGSATQRSVARVAGFAHVIPQGAPEGITIPVASGSARTDIVALRYDPSYTGAPGPVRLVRVAGTSSGIPVYDAAPPGVEDLPLWAVTRQPGQALSQATALRLFPRLAPSLDLPTGAPLPLSSPIGATARQGGTQYRRALDGSGNPVWLPASAPAVLVSYSAPFNTELVTFTATDTELLTFTIPDPGSAYRPVVEFALEAGTSPGQSARWDFHCGYGGAGNTPVTTLLVSSFNLLPAEQPVRYHSGTSAPGAALTGSRTYRLVAHRTTGTGSGTLTSSNRRFRVVYLAA